MKLRSTSLLLLISLSACTDSTTEATSGDSGATEGRTTHDATEGNDDSPSTTATTQGTGSATSGSQGDDDSTTGTATHADDTVGGDESTGGDESSTGEVPCTDPSECDNGIWCDGIEACVEGVCVAGEAPCDDAVACTDDVCDEGGRSCTHTPNDGACDNGVYCDGVESCDPQAGCQPGEAVVCPADEVTCTVAQCDEGAQGCVQIPDDALCDNGIFCDGQETCDPVQGCQVGMPLLCDDGIACTVDTCSEQTQGCVYQVDDSLCGCGETCDPNLGCGNHCVQVTCQGHLYQCGDCIDNDGDCLIDGNDPNCWGPCDNNEAGWKGEVPGQAGPSSCNKLDCYFDQDSGSGNDDCFWNHSCDPLQPMGCTYNPNANTPGTNLNCGQLEQTQSQQCHDVCGPLTPNGCDCFGCCEVYPDGETDPVTVFLGSEGPGGNGTCNYENATNPALCHPCTQVPACLNPCGECEVCIGKTELPDHCDAVDQCPGGEQPCGVEGQDPCNQGFFCLTGCCMPIPQ
mgnify:CR=1 FL=1